MGLVPLYVRPQRAPSPLLSCEDTARRQLSINKEAVPYQTLNLPAPASWTSAFRAVRNKCFCISHPVYGIFVIADQTKPSGRVCSQLVRSVGGLGTPEVWLGSEVRAVLLGLCPLACGA